MTIFNAALIAVAIVAAIIVCAFFCRAVIGLIREHQDAQRNQQVTPQPVETLDIERIARGYSVENYKHPRRRHIAIGAKRSK